MGSEASRVVSPESKKKSKEKGNRIKKGNHNARVTESPVEASPTSDADNQVEASQGGYQLVVENKKMETPTSASSEEASSPNGGGSAAVESMTVTTREMVKLLRSDDKEIVLETTKKLYDMVDGAWITPKYGRDLAYSISDTLRTDGGLDVILANCKSEEKELKGNSARLLEQIMTADNRDYVVRHGLDSVVKLACCRADTKLLQIGMGILENLFKHSEDTCTKVIDRGGLQAVLYTCRMNDNITLRHCAMALANCAMYGGPANQLRMIEARASEWLFPLAFSGDRSIRYYACLAVAVLAANQDIERQVVSSGTLELVEPFVTSQDPGLFAKSDKAHAQGRSEGWLKRLLPLLESTRREAKCLAAFHFAMEATIKQEQGRTKVFHDIGVIGHLQRVASSNNEIASSLAIQALKTIGEEIPAKLSFNICCWTVEEVQMWVKNIGFESFVESFKKHQVDGDLLLTITDEELQRDIDMSSNLLRRRFLRELTRLKVNSTSGDRELADWLKTLGPEYPQYMHNLIHCGIDLNLLPYVSDDHLSIDAGITNGVHRMKILRAIRPMGMEPYPQVFDSPSRKAVASMGDQADTAVTQHKTLDVFISYRRSTGSLLASLLKVHLQLRGFTVFIDVEKLEAGKFDNNLLTSVRNAHNFVMVLSQGALDRCKGDTEIKDWVHREIVAAIECKCNIVPVIDGFKWPKPEELPEDMRNICFFNGVKWSHDYQEACIEKLERFLTGMELNHPENDLASIYAANMQGRRISRGRGIEQQISYEGYVQVRRGSRGAVLDQQMMSPEGFSAGRRPLDQQQSVEGNSRGRATRGHGDQQISPNLNSH